MKKWYGAAAICMNEHNELLMVKQGTPDEPKRWSVPSGEREKGETFEECCIREVKEETGYDIRIIRPLFVKRDKIPDLKIEVYYFEVEVVGGKAVIQDPDNLIYEIGWKTVDEIYTLELSFPEDREQLMALLHE